jgi:aminopeptidase N
MAHITANAPPTDYVLSEQEVRLEFFEGVGRVQGAAVFEFHVRTGAVDPRIRLNASQMTIRRVSVGRKLGDGTLRFEAVEYAYFDLLRTIVANDPDEPLQVKSLRNYYCHYRARSDGADEGEIEIPIGVQMERLAREDTGHGLAAKGKKAAYHSIQLRIEYELHAPVQSGLRFVEWDRQGFRRRRAYAYTHEATCGSGTTLCGGAGARSWFPCIDRPGLTTKMEILLVLPAGMTAVCSGLCIERRRKGRSDTFLFDVRHTPVGCVILRFALCEGGCAGL